MSRQEFGLVHPATRVPDVQARRNSPRQNPPEPRLVRSARAKVQFGRDPGWIDDVRNRFCRCSPVGAARAVGQGGRYPSGRLRSSRLIRREHDQHPSTRSRCRRCASPVCSITYCTHGSSVTEPMADAGKGDAHGEPTATDEPVSGRNSEKPE